MRFKTGAAPAERPGMQATGRRKSPAAVALLAVLLGTAAALGSVPLGAAPAGAYVARTYEARPGANLTSRFQALRAGDTLLLAPGTYAMGDIRPVLRRGTARAPITVRAKDPRRPPLLVGGMYLRSPDFWRLVRLRVNGTVGRTPALTLDGGNGWQVTGGEYFGARRTQAYANIAVSGGNGYPRGFALTNNCVHGAARSTRVKTDHNIYVNFHGAPGSGGVIASNTIFDHPNGAGIKLGDGGGTGAPGPWGVQVVRNTIAYGGRQILMSHDVRSNAVVGNLLVGSTEPFSPTDRRTTGIYALLVSGAGNVADHNYVHGASTALVDSGGRLRIGADNGVRPNPQLPVGSPGACSGLSPAYWKARYYGRTSEGTYLDW